MGDVVGRSARRRERRRAAPRRRGMKIGPVESLDSPPLHKVEVLEVELPLGLQLSYASIKSPIRLSLKCVVLTSVGLYTVLVLLLTIDILSLVSY